MHAERHLGALPEPCNHSAKADRAHGCSPLTHKHVSARRLLTLKPAQGPKLASCQRMNRGNAVLEPRDVQPGMHEINLLPAEGAQLGRSQSVPKGQQDHGRIAMPVAIPASRLDQPFDLSLNEIFTDAVMVVGPATTSNCSFYSGWRVTVVGVRPRDAAFIGQIPFKVRVTSITRYIKRTVIEAERGDEGARTPHHRVLQGSMETAKWPPGPEPIWTALHPVRTSRHDALY